ncbi:unnamed protein product [Adineta steineri]|uniref:Uncharacterized protein n=1 Tax=Adineta steineri TaxID=433720 RepID=A0A815RB56_9BILA|nr:unnamed protein product [Adineta steineri]CAF1506799.1 unnamed protein product [Adineta steineri]CAF3953098.1 unnamed protein product [Adineta steineri]CAF4121299.1 unnamed protein product [Adineta steineri]
MWEPIGSGSDFSIWINWEIEKAVEPYSTEQFIKYLKFTTHNCIAVYDNELVIMDRMKLNILFKYQCNNTITSMCVNPTTSTIINCGTIQSYVVTLQFNVISGQNYVSFKDLLCTNNDYMNDKCVHIRV